MNQREINIKGESYFVYRSGKRIIQAQDKTGKDRQIGFDRFKKYVSSLRKK
jgi:hypothetical protein